SPSRVVDLQDGISPEGVTLSAANVARSTTRALSSFTPARNGVPATTTEVRPAPAAVERAKLLERCDAGVLGDPRVTFAEQHAPRLEGYVDEPLVGVRLPVGPKVLAHFA